MGKPNSRAPGVDSDGEEPDAGKRRRKQELEQIRRNALAVKRNLRSRATTRKTKSGLEKALNKFAAKRKDVENVNQSQQPLLAKRTRATVISDENISISPKPLRLEGFFRGGIKGRELTRPLRPDEKLRQAILNSDALQLLQSGGLSRRYQNECEDEPVQAVVDSRTRAKISQVLNGSLQSNSDLDNSTSSSTMFTTSPVLGGFKGFRKKHQTNSNLKNTSSDVLFKNKKAEEGNRRSKEDTCEKLLFERENSDVHSKNTDHFSGISFNNSNGTLSRTTTPENEIFFANYTPAREKNKKVDEEIRNKANVLDTNLINFYLKSCKINSQKMNGDIWPNFKDPLRAVKSSLKATYINNYKDFIHRQQTLKALRSASVDVSSFSSRSEIMQEPDSAITRALKKSKSARIMSETRVTDTKSECLSNISNSRRNVLVHQVPEIAHFDRKKLPSPAYNNSEAGTLHSVAVNVTNSEPESETNYWKMKDIPPNRQEVIARFLRDCNTTQEHEEELNKKKNEEELSILRSQRDDRRGSENYHTEKSEIFVGKATKETFLIHKGVKHVPAILRKNRSLVDCVAKGKVLLSIEKCSKMNVTENSQMTDLHGHDDFITERTPNSGSAYTESVEAPKCKNVYMNAKYNNRPTWINMPPLYNKKPARNPEPERQRLFTSPRNVKKNIVLSQSFEVSPIRQHSDISGSDGDAFRWQLSQGSLDQGGNCMNRMVSFGDIQEKTDRLTIKSSQGQSCSQEMMNEQRPPPQLYQQRPSYYHQNYQSTIENHAPFNNQKRAVHRELSSAKSHALVLNSDHQYHPHSTTNQPEQQQFTGGNQYQLVPSQSFSTCDSEDFDYHKTNGISICESQSSQQVYPESYMACVPAQQQSVMQPIKFIGIEGNRAPQRRPIYNPSDVSSYTYLHKTSTANQPSCVRKMTISNNQPPSQVLKAVYSADASSNPHYTMSSIRWQNQEAPQCLVPTSYDHCNSKISSIVVSNDHNAPVHRNQVQDLTRSTINYVRNCNTGQTVIGHQNIPMHNLVENHKYMGQHVQRQIPPSVYPQIEYQHEYCNNNANCRITDHC